MSPYSDVAHLMKGRTIARIVLDAATIARRVRELGAEIGAAYPDGDLLVLGLLKGSFIFLSDLVRQVPRPLQVDFLVVSSYGNDMVSSGVVKLVYDPATVLEGKHILLVEDIIDSGHTISAVMDLLTTRKPASICVCTLLDKADRREVFVPLKYIGFSIPNKFVFGYGLDIDDYYRNLPFIGVVDLEKYQSGL